MNLFSERTLATECTSLNSSTTSVCRCAPRDCLWKFFLPADYQPMKVSETSQPGNPRQIQAFELRMNIIADATIDLLFTKNRVRHRGFSSSVNIRLIFRRRLSNTVALAFVLVARKQTPSM